MVEGLLTGLLARSLYDIALHTTKHTRKHKKSAASAATFFSEYTVVEEVGREAALEGLPDDETVRILADPHCKALVQELLYAHILNLPDSEMQGIERAFATIVEESSKASPEMRHKFALALFEYVNIACVALMLKVESLDNETQDGIRAMANGGYMISVARGIERHLSIIANAGTQAKSAFAEYLKCYVDKVMLRHGKLVLPDFETERHVPIGDLYVDPAIRIGNTIHQQALEAVGALPRVVVLGDPGSGKSTLANVAMFNSAATGSSTPFLVILRQYESDQLNGLSIVQHIERTLNSKYQSSPPTGWIQSTLATGDALVIFDGLDELVKASRRREVRDAVQAFCIEYPLARIIITSRAIGYGQAPMDPDSFELGKLQAFTPEGVELYAKNWFKHSLVNFSPSEINKRVSHFIDESQTVGDLRSNPLMLSLMCVLYRGSNYIPESRLSLYEECAKLLFIKWDRSREIEVSLEIGPDIEIALMHLAHWMMEDNRAATGVTESELSRQVSKLLNERTFEEKTSADRAAEEFVRFCRGRAWVLADAGLSREGEALYTFSHRTFLEYYAATQLSRLAGSPEAVAIDLAPRLAKGEWDVVGQLAVQIADKVHDQGADRLLNQLLERALLETSQGKQAIVLFAASSTHYASTRPDTVRRIVREGWDLLFSAEVSDHRRPLPIRTTMGAAPRLRDYVSSELKARLVQLVAAGSEVQLGSPHASSAYALCALSPSLAIATDARHSESVGYWRDWRASLGNLLAWDDKFNDQSGTAAMAAVEVGQLSVGGFASLHSAALLFDGPEGSAIGFNRVGTLGLLSGWLRGHFTRSVFDAEMINPILGSLETFLGSSFDGFDCAPPVFSSRVFSSGRDRIQEVSADRLGAAVVLLCMDWESRSTSLVESADGTTTESHRALQLVDSLAAFRIDSLEGRISREELDRSLLDLFSQDIVSVLDRWSSGKVSFWAGEKSPVPSSPPFDGSGPQILDITDGTLDHLGY